MRYLEDEKTNLSSRLGDGTKVVNHISLGHTNTGITNRESLALLVGDDADEELLLGIEDRGVGQGGVTNFIESIRGVGNQLSKEDLLVRVESVYSQ